MSPADRGRLSEPRSPLTLSRPHVRNERSRRAPELFRSWPRLCENRFVSCQGEIPRNWFRRFVWEPETSEAPIGHQKSPLSLNGLQQGSAAQNRYNTLHVVGEHIECHLGCDLVSSSHQEVRRTHPSLYGPERMLCRLTTQVILLGS